MDIGSEIKKIKDKKESSRKLGIERIKIPATAEQYACLGQLWSEIYNAYSLDLGEDKETKKMGYWRELILWATAHYASRLDLKKPIGIINTTTGTGKTLSMKTLSKIAEIYNWGYYRNGNRAKLKFNVIPSLTIYSDFKKHGFDGILKYEYMGGLCIDDLGEEPTMGSDYGDEVCVLGYVLKQRFNNGLWTHWTTNVPLRELGKKYGQRVYSRLKGETNVMNITSENNDLRIKNTI